MRALAVARMEPNHWRKRAPVKSLVIVRGVEQLAVQIAIDHGTASRPISAGERSTSQRACFDRNCGMTTNEASRAAAIKVVTRKTGMLSRC